MSENSRILSDQALDTLFRTARTYNGWQDKDVSDVLLQAVYDLAKWGPTEANTCPARFVFVKSKEAKERLKPLLDKGNQEKAMEAPVTVLIANDYKFYEHMGKLAPHGNARSWYEHKPEKITVTATRSGTLQGAYLMLAARSLGLDCGPMAGFNADGVRKEFFAGQDVVVNFICSLGYGKPESVYPRAPRFEFSDICKVV